MNQNGLNPPLLRRRKHGHLPRTNTTSKKGEPPRVSADDLQTVSPSTRRLPAQPELSSDSATENWERNLRMRFQPSRNGHIHSVLAATAATSQRSGDAPQSFMPKGASPTAALTIAKQIDPFDRVLNTVLSSRARSSIRRTVSNTHTHTQSKRRDTGISGTWKGLVSNFDLYARGSRLASRWEHLRGTSTFY